MRSNGRLAACRLTVVLAVFCLPGCFARSAEGPGERAADAPSATVVVGETVSSPPESQVDLVMGPGSPEGPIEQATADAGEPRKLSGPRMMAAWLADEEKMIEAIASETFEQTLDAMIDWESNYYKLVMNRADPRPALPHHLPLIVHCRRFAKLLEETRSGLTEEQINVTLSRLRGDLAQWRRLVSEGQDLGGRNVALHDPGVDSAELIGPLTTRIVATILFMGERRIHEGLPAIVETVDTLETFTNWSAVGYACDRIMSSMSREGLSPRREQVLAEYAAWKEELEDQKFFQYEVLELPSFASARRPYERATVLGAGLDLDKGTITVEMPPIYRVWPLRSGEKVWTGTFDDKSGLNAVAQGIAAYARRFCEAAE